MLTLPKHSINMATLTEHKQNDFSLLVEAAARLAQRLHQGQVDKAGMDYFSGHLTAVAAKGRTWQEQVVGYLHDAAEDTPHTVEEVIQLLEAELGAPITMLYRDELSTALHLLNHHAAADRNAYIEAIGQNPLATTVKLHDLSHNMDLSRLPHPTRKDYGRLERYKQEYHYLSKNNDCTFNTEVQ